MVQDSNSAQSSRILWANGSVPLICLLGRPAAALTWVWLGCYIASIYSLFTSPHRSHLTGPLFWDPPFCSGILTFLWIVGASFQGVPGSQEDKSPGQGPYFLSSKTKTRVICLIMCPGTGSPERDSVPEGSYWITRLFLSRLFTYTNLSVNVKGKKSISLCKKHFSL